MKNILKYKNFIGSVNYSPEDDILFGKIEEIDDLISFEGKNVEQIKSAFYEAVDDYIEICDSLKKPVYKSYKGSFNVRISPEIHKKAVHKSLELGISLNQLVQKAIEKEIQK
jgi:predicted HicB family RNase H-like nuclease